MEVTELALDDIEVGDRFRKDYDLDEEFLDSIRSKGIIQPITVTQNLKLVAGGRRLAAAKLLELPSIPALIRQTDDELDLRECELIENVFRKEFNWVERNASVARIHELTIEKYGVERGSVTKVAKLLDRNQGGISRALQMHKEVTRLPKLAECKTEDEAVKLIRKMKEKVAAQLLAQQHEERTEGIEGDGHVIAEVHLADAEDKAPTNVKLAMYAKNHFRIGDAFEGMQEMIDNKLSPPIAFVEVDPPYGIDLKKVKKGERSTELDKYEEVHASDYPAFIEKLSRYLFEVTPSNTRLCFWFGIEWYGLVRSSLESAGFLVDPIPCVWTKRAGQTNSPERYLARAWEPFFVATKGEGIPIRQRGRTNVFEFPVVPATRKYHPTQRPIALMREILRTFAWEGSIIMVPFLGSGATLRAAYLEGITGWGWELNKGNKKPFLAKIESDIEDTLNEVSIVD